MPQMQCYRINVPAITHEMLGQEVVIVHLKKGNYYGLEGIGAVIWGLITQEFSGDHIVYYIQHHYLGDCQEIEEGVLAFLEHLRQEDIISLTCNEQQNSSIQEFNSHQNQKDIFFVKPCLKKYADMQDLLFLEPVPDCEEIDCPSFV